MQYLMQVKVAPSNPCDKTLDANPNETERICRVPN